MDYLIALLAGCTYGAAVGGLKYLILWRPLAHQKRQFTDRNIMIAQIISIMVSVIVLLSVFFLRDFWPYSFELTILGAAIGLSIMGRLSPLRDIKKIESAVNAKNSESIKDNSQNSCK